jgi:hypothetical protein
MAKNIDLENFILKGKDLKGGPEIFSEEVTGKNTLLTNDLQFVFLLDLA